VLRSPRPDVSTPITNPSDTTRSTLR
jgi:hypothetical protein